MKGFDDTANTQVDALISVDSTTAPDLTTPWFDSHCHLQDFDDPEAVVAMANESGVGGMVCVGTDGPGSARAVELASSIDGNVWATVGLHPHGASEGVTAVIELLERLVAGTPDGLVGQSAGTQAGPVDAPAGRAHELFRNRVVGVGECGLDYHYDYSPRDAQRKVFAAQVALAAEYGLALVVHTREAWDDTLDILSAEGMPERTVLHCFTGGPLEARRGLDLGCYLSFSGLVTFKNAGEVREAAALCPAERILLETDSPFLAPVPHRGKRNEPSLLPCVAAVVSQVRSELPAELATQVYRNTVEAFDLGASVAAHSAGAT